jgi:hypothetical protein
MKKLASGGRRRRWVALIGCEEEGESSHALIEIRALAAAARRRSKAFAAAPVILDDGRF